MMAWPTRPDGHTPEKTGRPDEPWLTRDAISYLDRTLTMDHCVLEFGAGGSTAWFATRASKVLSVEHDLGWCGLVNRNLKELGVENARVHHVSDENDFEGYVQMGRTLASQELLSLVVIVDGRRRVRCIKAVAEFVSHGGMIVLDNAERPNYAQAHEFLKDWFVKRTDNGIWRTDVFRR